MARPLKKGFGADNIEYDKDGAGGNKPISIKQKLDEVATGIEAVHVMTTAVVDGANGAWQKRTLAGNETFTFTLVAGQSIFATVVPGANTLTLTNVDEWVGGIAPPVIEAEHAFVFWSDDGVTVTGQSVGGIS